jgi:hypothetical protein
MTIAAAGGEQDRRDEALGRLLDEHFDSLAANTAPLETTDEDRGLAELRPVLVGLNELRAYLAGPDSDTMTWDGGATGAGEAVTGPARPELVGKYEIVRPLGSGGQASAVLAFDPDLRRHVVVKRYHEARTPEQQDAVLKEGRALARVQSPFVARCLSAERDNGAPYLVVEYVPGRNLAEQLRAGPVPVELAAALVARLAEGLAAVHACGLLHRDIKPANVIVGDDGAPRLVDFGLACPFAGEDLRRVSGTLPYMAPEQARGESERIDPRTDVYGLGAVLYELLTGRQPHANPDRNALWEEVRSGRVTPAVKLNPTVGEALNAICMRCLAADPGRRFASAAALAAELQNWQLGHVRGKMRLKWLVAATGAAAVLLVGFAWAPWRGAPQGTAGGVQPASAAPGLGGGPKPVGTPLHQDFPVTVEAVGTDADPDGRLVIPLGGDVAFRVTPARAAYVAAWAVSDDAVVQLFPNKWEPDHWLEAGVPRLIPGRAAYAVRATSVSTGPEQVIVFASAVPFDPPTAANFRGAGPGGGFVALGPEQFDDVLRGIELVAREPRVAGPAATAKVVVPFVVRPKQ